jgi:hypothetical protein
MANVLTDLAGDIYVAADKVSREQVGIIPAVTMNANGSERVALNDTVRSFFTRSATAVDNAPAMTIPEGTDQTVDNKTLSITKSRGVQIPWTGEDVRHVNNGNGFDTIYGDQIAQAMRTLTNEMETDLSVAAVAAASRSYGTAGTTPFSTANDYTDATYALKILKDNGAEGLDNSMVINSAAGANFLGKQSAVNSAGTDSMLRQGVILDVSGMPIRESSQIQDHTAGTGASGTTDATGYAVGVTSITLASAGTGTILTGDSITFAGDDEKYIVVTGDADISGGGTIVIAEPGLQKAIPAAATAITVSANSAQNLAFARSAVELAVRAPAKPSGGDAAEDEMVVIDPRSGLAFDVSFYKGFQKAMINVSAAWGVKAWKGEHIAILLG